MNPILHIDGGSRVEVARAAERLHTLLPAGRVVAVTDPNVARCCGEVLAPFERIELPTGEEHKTLRTLEGVWRELLRRGVDRSTFLLAVGGGIVSDVAGFAAATYMRGLRMGVVSTTLLGQVDASVGGKNGINFDGYKNMVGTFRQPEFVLCDPSLLRTLPDREFRAGLAEAVKTAILGDAALFALLEGTDFDALRRNEALTGEVVLRCIRLKAAIVGRDACERGERRKLNLGHTLAHAIEKCSDAMNHGEAVAVGLHLMARMAVDMGCLDADAAARIDRLLERMGFTLTPPLPVGALLDAVEHDKKAEGDALHIVLPTAVGDCTVRRMPREEFRRRATVL